MEVYVFCHGYRLRFSTMVAMMATKAPIYTTLRLLICMLMSTFLACSAHDRGAGYSAAARLLSGTAAAEATKARWQIPTIDGFR